MNFGTAFYLVSQVPAQACGVVLLLLFLIQAFIGVRFASDDRRVRDWFSTIDYRRAAWLLAGVVLFAMGQLLFLPYPLSPFTIVHMALYVVLFGAQRGWRDARVSHGVLLFVAWLNVAILVSSVLPPLRDIFFIERSGGLRFQSYYSEPSVAAFTYVFNLQQLWSQRTRRGSVAGMACSLVCLLPTFSGSGLALLMLLVLTNFGTGQGLVRSAGLLFLMLLGLVLVRFIAADAFDQMLVARLQGIVGVSGQADNSTFLRFVVPWLFLADMITNGNFAFTGVGLGGLVNYIDRNQVHLWYLVDFNGETLYSINNGYAVVMALFGLPIGILLLVILLYLVYRSPESRANKTMLLAYPFFSGFLIHPFIWLLLADAIWRKAPAPEGQH